MSLSALKKNSKSASARLSEELDKATGKQNFNDDRFWYPERDKAGNAYAVLRFLPGTNDGNDSPFVRYWEHRFQGPTDKWYIEKSLTTFNQPDPCAEYNTELWGQGEGSPGRKQASAQKRWLVFVSNVYVIEDPAKPENQGKVWLFKYGKRIYDKIYLANNPESDRIKKIDPFDLWTGANFILRVRRADGQTNYSESQFEAPSPLLGGDEKALEAVYSQCHSLKEFVDPKTFKTYDELQKRLNFVLGLNQPNKKSVVSVPEEQSPPWKTDYEKIHADNYEPEPTAVDASITDSAWLSDGEVPEDMTGSHRDDPLNNVTDDDEDFLKNVLSD